MESDALFTTSLRNIPSMTSADVFRLVELNSIAPHSKLNKGYKFFHENYIFNYEGKERSIHSHAFAKVIFLYLYNIVKLRHLHLYSAFNNADCSKAGLQRYKDRLV